MSEILLQYQRIHPTTWAYLSSLLTIAIYFKFNRVLSIRNWDLVMLILLAPGLLMVQYGLDHWLNEKGQWIQQIGYVWLFAINGILLLRLLLDAFMVRRPLLEPNLSTGGMTFLGVALCMFLMANVITGPAEVADVIGSQRAADLRDRATSEKETTSLQTHGPGFPLIFLLPHISTRSFLGEEGQRETLIPSTENTPAEAVPLVHVVTARVMAVISQMAIVAALVFVGARHFENIKTGIAIGTLYLLLPYTAMWTGSVTQALPGALLVWAIALYRRPVLSGAMLGLACGTIYYPVFLLPLWISFYWDRGLRWFLIGMLSMIALLVIALAVTAGNLSAFLENVRQMFGLGVPTMNQLDGAWHFWNPIYRYPLVAAHIGLSLSMALWPAQKNLATLIAYSAAVMIATQFWYAHSGGLAPAWYLPLLLLTIFRPNLEDRVATAVVK